MKSNSRKLLVLFFFVVLVFAINQVIRCQFDEIVLKHAVQSGQLMSANLDKLKEVEQLIESDDPAKSSRGYAFLMRAMRGDNVWPLVMNREEKEVILIEEDEDYEHIKVGMLVRKEGVKCVCFDTLYYWVNVKSITDNPEKK